MVAIRRWAALLALWLAVAHGSPAHAGPLGGSGGVDSSTCPTCEFTTNKDQASGYAGLTAGSKLNAAQGQEVWGVADLSDFASKSGSGTAALGSTLTSLTTNDILTWNGTAWVNTNSPTLAGLTLATTPLAYGSGGTGATGSAYTTNRLAKFGASALANSAVSDDGALVTLNSEPLAITHGTITSAVPTLDSSVTWNNAGVTFTHWKANVTDTASASGSLLADLQVGGSSKFKVKKNGDAVISADTGLERVMAGQLKVTDGVGSYRDILVRTLATNTAGGFSNGIVLGAGDELSFQSSEQVRDVILVRNDPNILAQRNGTAGQKHRWYQSYTDASNGSWGEVDLTSAGILQFGSNGNGTGAATLGKLQFNVLATNKLDYAVTTAARWTFATQVDAPTVNATTGFSANGTAGITKTCSAMPTAMTITEGIVTSVTGGTCS